MVLNCYDLRTHTRQQLELAAVTFAADVIRTMRAQLFQKNLLNCILMGAYDYLLEPC
jgi:hypothetical protein